MPRRCYPFIETEAEGQKIHHALAKRCQEMFQDQFIYSNPWLEELIEDDLKGYVPIQHILTDETIKTILQPLNLELHQQIFLIRRAIEQESRLLKANTVAIRKHTPFQNCKKQVKFFYIDGFEEGTTKFELLRKLNLKDQVSKVQIKKKHIPYARIYYADQRQVDEKKESWKKLHGLETQTYSIHSANLTLFDNVRTQELNPSAQKIMENFWNEKTEKQMEDEYEESDEDIPIQPFSGGETIVGDPRHGKLNKQDMEKMERRISGKYQLEMKSFDNNCLF